MPYLGDRAARLYYDDGCGPCRLLARAAEGASRHRLVSTPLASATADRDLAALSPEQRFGSAHLLTSEGLRSSERMPLSLLGVVAGPTVQRVVERVPWLGGSLRRAYTYLWTARRDRGCGAR